MQAMQSSSLTRWALPVVVVLVLAAVVGWSMRGSDSTVELSLGEADALASCLEFNTATLAEMPVALLGTVDAVDGEQVTLRVNRWYRGGDADVVNLVGEHTSTALIAGFEFEPGDEYYISATDGSVNYCGYSGPANNELATAYAAAFAN